MTFRQINLSAVETTITALADPLIALNSSASGSNSKDLGILMNRGSDTNVALLWDESTDQFAFVSTSETGTTAGDVTITAYSDLRLNDLTADDITSATISATSGFTGNLVGNVVGSTTGINYGNVTVAVGTSTFNNITMAGNLIVNGSTTTVSSTNTTLADNLIELNSGAGDNDADAGIVIERGSTGDNAFMGWDESSDSFILGTTTATGSSIGNLTITPTALHLGSLDITNTTAGSDAGPVITLHRDITGADANYIGQIKFTADNDADQSTVFAKITGKIDDASDGTEDGIIEIAHKKAGSNNISARFTSDKLKLINGTGLEVDGDLNMGDNNYLKMGDGEDFQIHHDGTNSIIRSTNHRTWIQTNSILEISKFGGAEYMARFIADGAVELRHNNTARLTTTSTGATINGSLLTTNIYGASDTNTGIQFEGSDVITLHTGGAEHIRIDSLGRAGFGISSPLARIHAKQHSVSYGIVVEANGNDSWLRLHHNDSLGIIETTYNSSAGFSPLTFKVSNAERMRIDTSGRVGIGTSSPSEVLHVVGNILASGDVTAYSDERLKDNIQTIDGALGKVNSMRGVTYTKDGLESSGVIAQEIEKIAPELVKDGEYKSVAYGNLVGYLIEAIKEQQKQIDQSKTEIENLKKEIRG